LYKQGFIALSLILQAVKCHAVTVNIRQQIILNSISIITDVKAE